MISGSPSSTWSAARIPIARKGDQVYIRFVSLTCLRLRKVWRVATISGN
ncbi:hypothetical protein [Paraburkholderia bannensis]|nr:hypothetical protein [Paraburkholderia bannensis]